jgi:hemolysin activation/secretion protein
MGGSVAVRAARIFGSIDALVVLSPTGFSPDVQPFFVDLASDIALGTEYGRIPIRMLFNTRLGERYSSGYPANLLEEGSPVPLLVIQSRRDRFAGAERVRTALEGVFDLADWLVVPGEMHADALLDPLTVSRIREWLDGVFSGEQASPEIRDRRRVTGASDSPSVILTGDVPLPVDLLLHELGIRLARWGGPRRSAEVVQGVKDVLMFHGYTRSTVSLASRRAPYEIHVSVPRIHSVTVRGNRRVPEAYIRRLLRMGGDYFNAYEVDAAIRRVSAEPAVRMVTPKVFVREDGDLDIHLTVVERRPLRAIFSAKNTETDKFYGLGFTWNEFNPPGLRLEGSATVGVLHGDLLTRLGVSKGIAGDHLRFAARYFDTIKSRDDVDFVYTRQEVREVGGEIEVRYRATSTAILTLGVFGKEYESLETTSGLRVVEGDSYGGVLKFDVYGKMPLQGPPILQWKHTSYLQLAGLFRRGDFNFGTYQANLSGTFRLWRHLESVTTFHLGVMGGDVPPQEQFSLGGMMTLPGYADDAFVGTGFSRVSQAVRVGLASWLDETSPLNPLRFIVSFNGGAVRRAGRALDASDLRMDVGFEMDYEERVRLGIAIPVGPLRADSPRVYIGWGPHVVR